MVGNFDADPFPLSAYQSIYLYRLELLEEVQRLAASIGVEGDVSYTCETADYFRLYQVQSRIEAFEADMQKASKEKGGECGVKGEGVSCCFCCLSPILAFALFLLISDHPFPSLPLIPTYS